MGRRRRFLVGHQGGLGRHFALQQGAARQRPRGRGQDHRRATRTAATTSSPARSPISPARRKSPRASAYRSKTSPCSTGTSRASRADSGFSPLSRLRERGVANEVCDGVRAATTSPGSGRRRIENDLRSDRPRRDPARRAPRYRHRRARRPHRRDRARASPPRRATEVDARGRLVAPPFVDCHFHMDATLSLGLPRLNQSGTLLEGIALWGELKPLLTARGGRRARAALLRSRGAPRPARGAHACRRLRRPADRGRSAARRAARR